MRHSLKTLAVATLVVLVAACGSAAQPAATAEAGSLPERSATAGGVEVKTRPTQLDSSGAAFAVTLDTHSGSLDADLGAGSTLLVDGTSWPSAGWEGDPPGGHHRQGTLRFGAGGPVAGVITLRIDGLGQPATFTWHIAGSS